VTHPAAPAEFPSLLVTDDLLEDAPVVTPRRRFLRRLRRQRLAVVALVFLACLALAALLAPFLPLPDPNAQDFSRALQPIGTSGHLLGTDWDGRDLLSRVVFGARYSLMAAVESVAVGLVLGVPAGLAAGYLGGLADMLMSRIVDAMLSFPFLTIAIAVVGILGPGLAKAMFAVGVLFSPVLFRVVRASVLVVREETFIEAARAIGCSTRRIIVRHVLPNALSPLLVQAALFMGLGLLAEAGLSFLGLGVQPPNASWGSMIGLGFSYVSRSYWVILLPGLCIMLTVMAFNVVADGLRDALAGSQRRGG
jgi:peptide/nickel transport system permease protein